MDNIDDYYLNPNIDGSLQDFFDRVWDSVATHIPVKLNVRQLTLLAILDCIDAAIDHNDKLKFMLLARQLVVFKRMYH